MNEKSKSERKLLSTVLVLLFIILVVVLLCYLPENMGLWEPPSWHTE